MLLEVFPSYADRRVVIGGNGTNATMTSDEARQVALQMIDVADAIDAARPCRFNASSSLIRPLDHAA